jgi:predicted hotdog family 3-hydroxylacyl-ACP dehydratase
MISKENILSLIPQRSPFVMIDQLLACDELGSRTELCIAPENILVADGELSEAGLIENIAQTVAAGAGYTALKNNEKVSIGYIGAVKNLEITGLPKIGDIINTEVAVVNNVFDVKIVNGKVECRGVTIAKCEMKIFIKN